MYFIVDNGGGADWIMDFSAARDRIDLSRLETDSDALHLRDVGQNVRIIVEGVSIMVMNAEVADFTADQFLFSSQRRYRKSIWRDKIIAQPGVVPFVDFPDPRFAFAGQPDGFWHLMPNPF